MPMLLNIFFVRNLFLVFVTILAAKHLVVIFIFLNLFVVISFQIVRPLFRASGLECLRENSLTFDLNIEVYLLLVTRYCLLVTKFPTNCGFSLNMTATAGKVLGVSQTGKIATGTRPGGVSDRAWTEVGLSGTGGDPPPRLPG